MTLEFNKRIDKSASFLEDYFNIHPDHDPMSKGEAKEVLTTILELLREDL